MLLEKMSGPDVHASSVDREQKTNEQFEKEIAVLRRRLRDAHDVVDGMAGQMELQKTRTRQLIAGWKIRLQEGDEKVLRCAREKDAELTELASELLFIEGRLTKERREIVARIAGRDARIQQLETTVRRQEAQIRALNRANEKLLGSLHEMSLEDSPGESASSPPSSPSSPSSPPYSPLDPPMENGNGAQHHQPDDFSHHPNHVPTQTHQHQSPPPHHHQHHHHRHHKRDHHPAKEQQQPHAEPARGARQRASTVEIPPSRRNRRRGLPNGSILAQNNNNKTADSSLQQQQQHRVRFRDEVFHDNGGGEFGDDIDGAGEDDVEEPLTMDPRIRKISLPAYRLPTDEEDSIRFF